MEIKNTAKLKIEFYSGYKGDETPRRIWLGSKQIEIMEIVKRWMSPDERYFKVKGDNGSTYTICQDLSSYKWKVYL